MFRKILIANRGEVAVRILRTCRAMGIPTAVVYSDADRSSLAVRLAEEAVHLGTADAAESYLNIERILTAAQRVGADAIHPGYGFLAENAGFVSACQNAGVKFIGPDPAAMRLMGSKTDARQAIEKAGVPVVPGTAEPLTDLSSALRVAGDIGYPVMLKAAAGGGGKGMRWVSSAEEMPSAFEQGRHESLRAFGSEEIYLEKAIVSPRHVEVQILADEHGNVIHLGERECSLQRRHQKVLEESPSPLVKRHPDVREKITSAAVRAAKSAGYTNAGTVEFLMDEECNFYFLEMNTRLQVEHPVTEMVTGVDLVMEQIRVASGEALRYQQRDIRPRGSAIECRIYAEDPDNNFFPSPGRIHTLVEPSGPGVRVDSSAYEGWSVPVEYDPLIAKLVVWGQSRAQAIDRLRGALREYHIGGIKTTLGFFREVVCDQDFGKGSFHTGFIPRWLETRKTGNGETAPETEEAIAVLAAAVHFRKKAHERLLRPETDASAWKLIGKRSMLGGV